MAAAYLQTRPSKRSKKMEDDHARAGHFYICDILSFTYCHHSTNLTVFPRWPTSLFDFSSFKKLNKPQQEKRKRLDNRLLGTVSTKKNDFYVSYHHLSNFSSCPIFLELHLFFFYYCHFFHEFFLQVKSLSY